MRSEYSLAICLLLAPSLSSAKMDATAVTTCELIDSGSTFDGQLVAVEAHINTDVMHFIHLESTGCSQKQISMYFAEDSNFRPCRDAECPLNGVDYLIEATFVGIYHAKQLTQHSELPTLEVKEVQGMTRTPRKQLSDPAFSAWVARARKLEETPSGKAYQDVMWPLVEPYVAALIKRCIADNAKEDLASFIWVATLNSDGKVTEVDVQPETEVTQCFFDGMLRAPFPKTPPEYADDGLPVTLNMRLHQMN
jgi:hypothetical protein